MFSTLVSTPLIILSSSLYSDCKSRLEFLESAKELEENSRNENVFVTGFLNIENPKKVDLDGEDCITLGIDRYEVRESIEIIGKSSRTVKNQIYLDSMLKFADVKLEHDFRFININNLLPIIHNSYSRQIGFKFQPTQNIEQDTLLSLDLDFSHLFKIKAQNSRVLGIKNNYTGVMYYPGDSWTIVGYFNGRQFTNSNNEIIIRKNTSFETIKKEIESEVRFCKYLTFGFLFGGIISACLEYNYKKSFF